MDKKRLSERDICKKLITPAIAVSGWSTDFQMHEGDSHRWARRRAWNKAHRDRNQIEKLLARTSTLKARLTAAQTKQAHMAEALIAEMV